MNSISSPTSHASCSTSQASYPEDLINSTLVSLFYLTSDGGFMSKNGYMPCHREKDGKLQIEVITNDYSFWINAKEISLRLNEMQRRRLMSDRSVHYAIVDGNGKFRCNHRIKSWKEMQLEQYQDMSRGCMQ